VALSTVATDSVFSPSILYGRRRSTPPNPSGSSPLPIVARAYFWPSRPPKTFVVPCSLTAVELSTTLRARRLAITSALSASMSSGRSPELSTNSTS
jgi:hypothetical protein